MALRAQMGLGGLGHVRGHVQVRVEILDLYGGTLFLSTFLPGAHMKALAHARYWLRRGGVLVRVTDSKGSTGRTFNSKRFT